MHVWTWVHNEDDHGRGNDCPVLVVAREGAGTLIAVRLSSQNHDAPDWFPLGPGRGTEKAGRPGSTSGGALRVHPLGMRREAAGLDRDRFDMVIGRLRDRYGWV